MFVDGFMNVKLGEIFEIGSGGTPSKKNPEYYNGNIPWIKTGDLKEKYLYKSEDYITELGLNNSSAKMCEPDTVLIAMYGATIGATSILKIPACTNQACATFKKSDKITPEFLYYFFRSQKERFVKDGVGGAQPNISAGYLKKIEIELLPLKKQNEITNTLDKLQSIITHIRTQLEKLDLLVKARFVEMFGDPIENPHKYPMIKYGDLFELNAGDTPSKTKPEYWENGTISWIGSNMCQNTIIYENDGKYITQQGYDNSSAKMFPVDTVLIALVGATIGKTALLKFETSTNQNVLGVRGIAKAGYNPLFVYYYTQFLYSKFMNIGDGGFNMASKSFISELPMYEIDIYKQSLFADFAEKTDKSKSILQQELTQTQTLFDSLMQEYFG